MNRLLDFDSEHLWHPYAALKNTPARFLTKTAHGTTIETADGLKLIDAVSSWWCMAHGHNAPEIVEAIVLATKVANAPGMVAEFCVSDDPNYVTGYVASKELGYVRIMKMKEMGDENGGRIFLFDSRKAKAEECIEYLQKKKVLVEVVNRT